jgi:hypothetical protein
MPRFLSSKPEASDFARYEPKDWSAYADWIRWFAKYHRGKITYYEVWNEPVASGFWANASDISSIVKLHEVTYKALKEGNPDAVVLGPCPYSFLFDFMQDFVAAGGAQWMDALVLHTYMADDPDRADFGAKLDRARAIFTHDGKVPDLYITEIGYHPAYYTEHQRAQNLVRTYLIAQAHGVKALIWYKMWDYSLVLKDREQLARWAIVRPDWSPTPAATALRTMVANLSGRKRLVSPANLVGTQRGSHYADSAYDVYVLYDFGDTPSTYRMHVGNKSATKIDIVGVVSDIVPDADGDIVLTLTHDPGYLRIVR